MCVGRGLPVGRQASGHETMAEQARALALKRGDFRGGGLVVQSLFTLSEVEGLPLWLDRPRKTTVSSFPLFSASSAPLRFGFFSPLAIPRQFANHPRSLPGGRQARMETAKQNTSRVDTSLAFKRISWPHLTPYLPSRSAHQS